MNQLVGQQIRVDLAKLGTRLSVIAGVMFGTGVLTAAIAMLAGSFEVLAAVILSLALCTVATLVGHVLSEYPEGDVFLLARILFSMCVRTGIPLIACLVVNLFFPALFSQGFVYFIVLFYLVGLIAEAVLSTVRLRSL